MQELRNKEDIKVFILYLLDNIGMPLNLTRINDIAMQDDFVRGIDFMECFMELVDNGSISMDTSSEEPLYSITHKGSEASRTLKDNLSGYVRARSVKSALKYLSFEKKGASIESRVENIGDKKLLVGKITEKGSEVFSFSFALENDYHLQLMKYNFEEDPERVYKAFMAILMGDSKSFGI